jgi:LDH2 family malate/lactate/ureidoglycolate dehydrogenase
LQNQRVEKMSDKHIDPSVCSDFIAAILGRLGAGTPMAQRWAELLVETSLLGFDTHGICMLDRYVKHIQAGGIDLAAEPRIIDDSGSCVRMDGQVGLGHIAADEATRIAVDRARQHGISCVTVKNCNHVGACGIYARQVAAQDCIGICSAVSKAGIAPWGGKQAILGLNVVAIAAPIAGKADFLLDIAMSRTAMGRITRALDLGQPISDRWALDADGNPTADPVEAKHGTLLPIGEHKGYGLAMAVEMLVALLGGGKFGYQATSWIQRPEEPMGQSFMAIVIDIRRFVEPDEFKSRFQVWAELLTNSPTRDGFERIYYPGEIEAETYARRMAEGIPIDSYTQDMFKGLAEQFGVEVPQSD